MVVTRKEPNVGEKMSLIVTITQAYKQMETDIRKYLKPYGISLQQYNVLKILKGAKEPLSTSVIRERMIQPMTDSSRLVDRLSTKGWVSRVACSIDKRLVDVTITEEGLAFLEQVPNVEPAIEKLYRKISQDEAEDLNHLLNKLRG